MLETKRVDWYVRWLVMGRECGQTYGGYTERELWAALSDARIWPFDITRIGN